MSCRTSPGERMLYRRAIDGPGRSFCDCSTYLTLNGNTTPSLKTLCPFQTQGPTSPQSAARGFRFSISISSSLTSDEGACRAVAWRKCVMELLSSSGVKGPTPSLLWLFLAVSKACPVPELLYLPPPGVLPADRLKRLGIRGRRLGRQAHTMPATGSAPASDQMVPSS